MVIDPCVRYKKIEPDGTRREIVISLTNNRLSWYGVQAAPHSNSNERCYLTACTSLVPEGTVKIGEDALRNGYKEEDCVLIDSNNDVIMEDGIATANEAMARAREMMEGLPKAEEGDKMPEKEMPPDPFYWEVQILIKPQTSLIHYIIHTQAALVSGAMPAYTDADVKALWAMMNRDEAMINGSDAAGEIPKDGSVRTLGHLMVLCKAAAEIQARWSTYAHLSVISGEWTLNSKGDVDRIALLQAAGLNRDAKEAPATRAAIALGLLPTPIDLSGAPDDDFYL